MDLQTPVDRRDFVKATGMLTGVLAAGSPLALLAPGRAWAVDLAALTSAQGAALLAVMRTIAPHDKLGDAAYALVVKSLDADAAKDAALHRLLVDGVASLGSGFAAATEAARIAALGKIETGDFFQTMRIRTLGGLYASPLAFAYFGYEGEAFSRGGYLRRGFNDLRWLPDPPPEAAGPVPA